MRCSAADAASRTAGLVDQTKHPGVDVLQIEPGDRPLRDGKGPFDDAVLHLGRGKSEGENRLQRHQWPAAPSGTWRHVPVSVSSSTMPFARSGSSAKVNVSVDPAYHIPSDTRAKVW